MGFLPLGTRLSSTVSLVKYSLSLKTCSCCCCAPVLTPKLTAAAACIKLQTTFSYGSQQQPKAAENMALLCQDVRGGGCYNPMSRALLNRTML